MKSTKGAILGYKPEPVPTDLPASAQRYLDQELNRIAGVLQGVLGLLTVLKSTKVFALEPTMVEPPTPTEPELIYVDGTAWDPGSGKGYYYWNGMVWTPIG